MSYDSNLIPVELEFYYFQLPLKQGFSLSLKAGLAPLTVREGVLIKLNDHINNIVSYGECAPLPGIHDETLDEALDFLAEAFDEDAELDLDPTLFNYEKLFFGLLSDEEDNDSIDEHENETCEEDLPSTVRFALEQAFYSWYIQLKKQENFSSPIKAQCHHMISAATPEIPEGSSIIKMKIGRSHSLNLLQELEILSASSFKGLVRLDPNRELSQEECHNILDFFKKNKELKLDYIEDGPIEYEDLPLALDATLFDYLNNKNRLDFNNIPKNTAALILKPTMLGLSLCERIVVDNNKRKNPLPIILSSTFDSAPTVLSYLPWLKRWNLEDKHHGFDTLRYLGQDLLPNPPSSKFLSLSSWNDIHWTKLNLKRLSKLSLFE